MEKKDVWTISDILANRNNWSLGSDAELLKHLQALSEKIFTKANATLRSLNAFENDVNQTCISIANTNNKFKALSDTQFIESKVQDESLDVDEPSGSQQKSSENPKHENTTVQLKEALENGFQVLDTQYDIIPVTGSDSEDDEPQEILLKARNPYLTRRLPFIIGSEEFTRNDTLGLVDSSSSEEDEDDEEDDDEEEEIEEKKIVEEIDSEEKYEVPIPAPPKTEFIRPQTQVIRISSSDSEDSEISIPSSRSSKGKSFDRNKSVEKPKENEAQTPYSFADHLSAALRSGIGNPYASVPPDFGDTFSPPPFPGKDSHDISSDDDHSDSSDMFAPKKNKHSVSATSFPKSRNYDDESDDNDDLCDNSKSWRANDIDVISREPPALGKTIQSSRKSSIVSQHSDLSSNSPVDDDLPKKDDRMSQPVKSKIGESNINSLNKKMVSAINAELNAKLKIKTSGTNKPETPVKSSRPKPSEKSTPISAKKEVKKPILFDELDNKSDHEVDNSNDLFSGLLHSKKTASKNTENTSLFDEEDDIDNLFKPSKPTPSNSKKLDKDVFSKTTKPEIPRESEPVPKPVTIDLFKKSDLFASDSDSEDDIFSIIKGQKKTAPKTDIFKKSTHDDESPIIKAKSDEKNEKTLTDSKSSTSLKSSSDDISLKKDVDELNKSKTNEVMKTSIFEDSSKNTKDLFQSDDDDEGDELFSKKKSTDNQIVRDVMNIPKSNLVADKGKIERSKQDNASFTDSFGSGDQNVSKEPTNSASLKSEKSSEKNKIFAENLVSRYSSSSEDDNIEPIIDSVTSSERSDLFGGKIQSKEQGDRKDIFQENLFGEKIPPMEPTSDADLEDNLFGENSQKIVLEEDLFGKKSQKEKQIVRKNIFEDSIGEKSKPVVPPNQENILEEDIFEKKSQKEKQVVQENIFEDSLEEKSKPVVPPSIENIFEEDLFEKKSQTEAHIDLSQEDLSDGERSKETTSSDDLFSKNSQTVIFNKESKSDLFGKQVEDDLFNEISKSVISPNANSSEKQFDDLFEKNADFVKTEPMIEPSSSIDEPKKPATLPESNQESDLFSIKNDISSKPKEDNISKNKDVGLFNFSKKDLFGSDSDSDDLDFIKTAKPSKSSTKPEESKKPSSPAVSEKEPFNFSKNEEKNSDSDDDVDVFKASTKPEESKQPSPPPILKKKPIQDDRPLSSVKDDKKNSDSDDGLDFFKTSKPSTKSEEFKKPSPSPILKKKPIEDNEPRSSVKDEKKNSNFDDGLDFFKASKPSTKLANFEKPSPPSILKKKPIQNNESLSSFKNDTKNLDSDNDLDFLKTSKPPKSPTKPEESIEPFSPPTPEKSANQIDEPVLSSLKDRIKKLSQSNEENDTKQSSPKINKKSNIFEKKAPADEQDGNIFTKTSPEPPSTRNVPGKLMVNRGLNINVNALLPGTNWSSKIKQKANENEPLISNEPENDSEESTSLLNNVTKERAKISGRRRPPTRMGRKSRIFNDDLFASTINEPSIDNRDDVIRDEPPPLPPPEKKSPIPSPRLSLTGNQILPKNETVESKKLAKADITDELFTRDDQMNDLFQTIGRAMGENINKSFGETNKGPTPPSMPSSLTSSKDSESDSEFSFGITPTPTSLPSLTKSRAKPQRHTVPKKSTPSDPLSDADKDEPVQEITKPMEKSNIFTDKVPPIVNSIKPVESTAKNLFDNLDEDDLFSTSKPRSTKEKPKPKPEVKVKTDSMPQTGKKPIDIFNDDDDDELFTTTKKKISGNKITKKNFLFEDNDDDDLFGKSSSQSGEKAKDPLFSSTKTKVSNEKPRIVKLRSETVQKDPLTGKDITDLR